MHRNVALTAGLIFYFMVAALAVQAFSISLPAAVIILLILPTLLLIRYSAAPSVMVVSIVGFGAGVTILLEGVAHIYGLWSIGLSGGLSLSVLGILIVLLLKLVFLTLFYELNFDDGFYQTSQARNRFVEFFFLAASILVLVWIFAYVFNNLNTPAAYYWITILLVACSLAMLSIRQKLTLHLYKKIVTFVAVAAIPALSVELVLVGGGYKEILTTLHLVYIPLFDLSLPLGEILLAFSVPTLLATVYELYLDDGK